MRKEPLISVIVNVYDSVQKLKKCLDTLKLQLYNNIEIICIDNGLSAEITAELYLYQSKDERFKIIHHEYSKASSAWNEGLKHSVGSYVHFINTNSWLLLDLYKVFAEKIQTCNADIYMFNANLYRDDVIDIPFYELFDSEDIKSVSENNIYSFKDINHIMTKNLRVFNKIYKKQFLEEYALFFAKNVYSEYLFNIQTLVKSKNIYVNNETYLRSSEQLIEEGKNTNGVADIFSMVIDVERFMSEEELFKYYVFDIFNYICNTLDSYYDYCPEEFKMHYFGQMQSGLRARFNSMPPQAQDILKNIEDVNFMLTSTFEEYNKKKQEVIL